MAENTSGKPRLQLNMQRYKGILFTSQEIEKIQIMEIRDDDVWVCSYPRSGTTLMQEMVYLIQTLDFDKAKSVQLDDRFPIVEVNDDRFPYYRGVGYIDKMTSPRMIKTHLHHFLLPEQLQKGKGRMIYMARNAKDIVTSLYRLMQWQDELRENDNTWDLFFQTFIDGTAVCCPWPDHVLGYWNRRNDPQVLFVKYEDVVKDLPAAVRQVAHFLARQLTDGDVFRICEHCSVSSMRNNDKVNMSYWKEVKHVNDNAEGGFINQGMAGAWKDFLSPDEAKRLDELIKQVEAEGLTFEKK